MSQAVPPPPQPLPDHLWGENWRFASIPASDLWDMFCDRPIPISVMPEALKPISLGLGSTDLVPGVVIYGGRQSMALARWIEAQQPARLFYQETDANLAGGLLLTGADQQRWVILTFQNEAIATAGQRYQQRLQVAQGLHFLLVQPDDSEVTHTGIWLFQA